MSQSFTILATSLIKQHEGLRLKPYHCTEGKLTIGYGRNLDDVGITESEAEYLLEQDMKASIVQASNFPFFAGLNEYRKAVIVDMIFNLGLSRFNQFKRMLNALQRHDYHQAATEMLDSRWATQVGIRADRLAQIMRTGELL